MRSILIITLTAIGLVALGFSIFYIAGWEWNKLYTYIGGFLWMLTILIDQINMMALRQQGRAVIVPYLASTVLKLLLSIVFLIVVVKVNTALVKELVIIFLSYYAVFSTVEIFLVRQRTKK